MISNFVGAKRNLLKDTITSLKIQRRRRKGSKDLKKNIEQYYIACVSNLTRRKYSGKTCRGL
jgi:hypothetical protein